MNAFVSADSKLLESAETVAQLVAQTGLNDEQPSEWPSCLAPFLGQGLRIWQYPCQFAPYLCYLRDKNIRRYMEIGVRHGGCFAATISYLSRFTPIELSVAVDAQHSDLAQAHAEALGGYFVRASSSDPIISLLARHIEWDLILIDGSHYEEWVRHDYDLMVDHTRFIAFHDIVNDSCPGVTRVWNDIKSAHPEHVLEWTDQYDELNTRGASYMGIGLLNCQNLRLAR